MIRRDRRLQYNIFGNVFLVNDTNNEKLLKIYDEYLNKYSKKDEKLSITSGVHPKDKEFIVELLLNGKTSFSFQKCRPSQTKSEYKLVQKTLNILLRDILNNNDSYVLGEAKPYLNGKIDLIKQSFNKSYKHIDDDINISSNQFLSLRDLIISRELKYHEIDIEDKSIKDKNY